MGDIEPVVGGAVVQAAPVFLDREAALENAVGSIEEAGAEYTEIVAFPAHPIWFHFHSGTDRAGVTLAVELFKNSMEGPGREIAALEAAAARAGTFVVMGVCEKLPNTFGAMYNTQVFIDTTRRA